jgi:predicted amidohydrolase
MRTRLSLIVVCTVLLTSTSLRAAESNRTTKLLLGSVSFVPAKWNKQANGERIERMVREAAKRGAQFVITPEGALEGYVVNEVIRQKDAVEKSRLTKRFQQIAEPVDGPYVVRFRELADELDIHLILGFLEADGAKTFNTAALIGPDGHIIGKYRKTHFHQGYEVNPPGYTPGDAYPVFDIGVMKVGIMICFDRQLPEPARALALGGADLIACPSYGGWGDWNTRVMRVRAYENHAYVVFTHPEQSLILNRDGKVLDECHKDEVAVFSIDLSDLRKTRQSVRMRRPETYRKLSTPPNE